MPNKILVTGGAGYIGSHVVKTLLDSGNAVVIIDSMENGHEALVDPRAVLYVGNIANREFLQQVLASERITAIMHFAAYTKVDESVLLPEKYFKNNFEATLCLAKIAVENGVKKFIFSSTAAVYGDGDIGLFSELHPTKPANPYGLSKLKAEEALASIADTAGMGLVILRYFNVAGADVSGRLGQMTRGATHLLKVACEVVTHQRDELLVFGADYSTYDGTCIRDFIHINDLANAHVLALDFLLAGHKGGVFNVGYGRGHSVMEVIKAFERITGREMPLKVVGRRPGDVAKVVADSTKIRQTLGWKPTYEDLEFICRTALKWEVGICGKL